MDDPMMHVAFDEHAGHGGHGGHGDMPGMPAMCQMNMLFNWQVEDVCVVYEWWHIRTTLDMILSCLAVFAIAAGYEYLRLQSSVMDQHWQEALLKKQAGTAQLSDASHPLPMPAGLTKRQEITRSTVYAVLVAISFWLMLVFMTYNGYLMAAVVVGAGVGHYAFGNGKLAASRSIQCH